MTIYFVDCNDLLSVGKYLASVFIGKFLSRIRAIFILTYPVFDITFFGTGRFLCCNFFKVMNLDI